MKHFIVARTFADAEASAQTDHAWTRVQNYLWQTPDGIDVAYLHTAEDLRGHAHGEVTLHLTHDHQEHRDWARVREIASVRSYQTVALDVA